MNFKLDYDILKFGLDDLCDKVYVLNFVDECDIVNLFLRCLYNFSYLVDFWLNCYDGVNLIYDMLVYLVDNIDLDYMK